MKRYIFYISIVLIVAGIVGRLYADQYSYVTPEGMVVDSAWLPIGTFMTCVGALALIVLGILSVVGYLRNRPKQ